MTSLAFDVFWRDHGAKKGLTELGSQADRTHGSFGKFTVGAGKGLGMVGKAAVSAGALGAVALAGIGAAGIGMGIKVASGNEQAKIGFTTMLGSAQKADKFLRQLQKFAAETPFEFPELQTAASSLISVGINSNKVIPIMKTLGNVTSGMGTGSEGVKRATVALQQMSAAGRISAEDLNQLRDAGLPLNSVFKAMSAQTGESVAKLNDMRDSGKLGRKELDALMKSLESGKGFERFNGLMEKQSHSLAGMASTLKDTLGQGLANAVAPSFPLIKQGIEDVSNVAAKFFGFLGKNRGSIATIFGSAGQTLKTMGAIGAAVFGSFAKSAAGGKNAFKTFADFLATHQEDITKGLVNGGKAALGLGKSLAIGASAGLRALATLSDASTGMTTIMLAGFSAILHGMAETWGFIPGIGPKLKAADKAFATFGRNAIAGMRKIGPGARAAADAIDKNVVPAIDKAQGSLDKIGKTQIAKAALRDSAAKAALAIKNIGTTSDGAQIKLKKFNDVSKLGATQQSALKARLSDARNALRAQIRTMQDAHAGQDKLTAAWQRGKDRLYAEFRQMGLSRTEARKLAAQYAGIKPKVRTTFSQPGMGKSRGDAKDYFDKLKRLPGHIGTSATLTFRNNAGKIVANLNKSFQLVKGGPRMTFATGGVFPGYTPGRDVHKFVSPTGGELQTSGGEAFMVPEFTKMMGGPKAIARMNEDARRGRPIQFARGGVYNAEVNANSREGTSGSQMYGWGVKRKLEGAMSYAEKHGTVRGGGYASALAYARRHAGHPYVYGTIWDCSGFMSSLHSIIKGEAPHRRYSTPAFHGSHAQGFTRGKQSAFMVGVRPLSGKLGHMAGTLNKVNVESAGGVGVRVGRSARGYNNGMFSWRGGLHTGGMATEPGVYQLAEKGPERVLSARQTQTYERLGRSLESTGGAPKVDLHFHFDNYFGSRQELVRELTKAEQSGQLDPLKRRFKS